MREKIFDIVYFSGNPNLIEMRIKKNSNFSEKIIIITNETNRKKIESINIPSDKVEVIVDNECWSNKKYYSKFILDKISTYYKSFDDFIVVSEENEFPNLENFDTDSGNLLNHKIYENSLYFHRKYFEYGSGVFTFSEILQNREFLVGMSLMKQKLPEYVSYEENGFTLNNFQLENETQTYTCPYSNLTVPLIKEKPLV